MSKRVDSASKLIFASASRIYQAFATRNAMETWLPPQGMTGRMVNFAFREGGAYRMRLTYNEPQHVAGKTSADADEVEVRFVKLVEGERIEQAVTFNSEDSAFSGEMRITWILEPLTDGTLVTVSCENVPPGIRQEDHKAGLMSTLNNLASFAEGTRKCEQSGR
ncbi:MAG: ATPase [Hydrogenophilales bacterium RIFOXYA1_FULL_63_33]|nr:MAG: ATPase [Hydrogenophilales bacterium RIFOXYA1_FULL_63_33]